MKLGIDLGGSHIAIGVVDIENGKIIEKMEKRITSIEKENIQKSIEETIINYSSQLINKYNIEQAIKNINDEMEEATKEFSKLFFSNENKL